MQNDPRLRVFVSSTSGGMQPYREAVAMGCEALDLKVVNMETLDPERRSPAEWSEDEVQRCDVLVLLLGHHYGTLAPGRELSYTHLEYDAAERTPQVEICAWVIGENAEWVSGRDGDENLARLQQLKSDVMANHVCRSFDSREDLQRQVMAVMHRLTLKPRSLGEVALGALTGRTLDQEPLNHDGRAVRDLYANPPYVGGLSFVGRESQLAWLDDWALSSDSVAVAQAIGGTGKSALAWEWFSGRSADAMPAMAGRFWWSFYQPENTVDVFQRAFLSYATSRSPSEIAELTPHEVERIFLETAATNRFLIVLDGFEQLLNAYHLFDAGDRTEDAIDLAAQASPGALADRKTFEFVRRLATVRKSKILVTTRLFPDAFEGLARQPLTGVRVLQLPGLTTAESRLLVAGLGIHGLSAASDEFFRGLDNHPLLLGIVAGLVKRFRPTPGDLSVWLADRAGGAEFNLATLTLTERSHHILAATLRGLLEEQVLLLQKLSLFAGATSWDVVQVMNPYRPRLSARPEEWEPLPQFVSDFLWDRRNKRLTDSSHPAQMQALGDLYRALEDLQDRGLLWWDVVGNAYDMHPVVRAYVLDTMPVDIRQGASAELRDHFGRLRNAEDPANASSLDDLSSSVHYFDALVGAGDLEGAEAFWDDGFGSALLYRLEAVDIAEKLLNRFFSEASRRGHPGAAMRWDLATVRSMRGEINAALELRLQIVGELAARTRPPASMFAALSNVESSYWSLGRRSEAAEVRDRMRVLAEISQEQELRSGYRMREAVRALAGGDFERALALAGELDVGRPYGPLAQWRGEVARIRYHALLGLGRLSDIGEVRLAEPAFGEGTSALRAWSNFVFDFALKVGDSTTALGAAESSIALMTPESRPSVTPRLVLAKALLGKEAGEDGQRLLSEASAELSDFLAFAKNRTLAAGTACITLVAARELGRPNDALEVGLASYQSALPDTEVAPGAVVELEALLRDLHCDIPQFRDQTSRQPFLLAEDTDAYLERLRRAASVRPQA